MSDEERGPWYLLTGLLLGVVLGLAYAWGVQPVEYVDTSPASLRKDFKDQYRALIAASYLANGDLVRAKARLELLGDEDMYRAISEQAQRTLAQDGSTHQARALGLLAIALGQEGPGPAIPSPPTRANPTLTSAPPTRTPAPSPSFTPAASSTPALTSTPSLTPQATQAPPSPAATETAAIASNEEGEITPTETPIPRPTTTLTPTRTPTPTPGGPFILMSREKLCDQKLAQPLIQIEAMNILGQPVPGVLVIVAWDQGEERFFTGLKPEKGLGYADFAPAPGVVYTIQLGEGGQAATDISAAECHSGSGESFWGAWVLKFVQP
ncbi:MAG: hypothetical protein JXA78_03700 [Anaerolineales bacterium]|nr:hypothetical protein [Anaerolineales bacterium]